MNKNTIIVIIIVIIIAAGAALIFGQNGKTGTQINFLSDDTLQNGEQVIIELKDSNGKAIAGETVNLTYDNNETYSVVTDSNGKGYFIISGEPSGQYDLVADYAGNDKYNGCTAKVTITITDGTANNAITLNSSSSSTTTGKYHENHTNSHEGCRYLGQFDMWVRNSDDTIVEAPMGKYIGMNYWDWYYLYGPGAGDDPTPNQNSTNATG